MRSCQESFSCSPSLAPFKHPFYNASDSSQCGLIRVNCSTTSNLNQIQLGDHQSYEITRRPLPDLSVLVRNRRFEQLVKANSCEALDYNFTSPTPLLFSISISFSMTVYKCTSHSNDSAHTFFEKHNYSSYDRCKDYKFYYKYSLNYTQVPSDLLQHRCQVIQLPVKLEKNPNHTNIFSLLSSNFSLSFQLSPSCIECTDIKGGQCNTHNGQFQKATQKTETDSTLIVGTMVTLIVIILCLIKILFQTCSHFVTLIWRTKAKNDVNEEMILKNHEFLAPKRYSYLQVKKMTNSFSVKLGQGGFGSVYRGALSNGNLVAVKVLNGLKGKGEDFVNEVASVGRTSHVNIVSLMGFCLEGRHRALIYEFMPNGSLERFIYGWGSSSNSHLGWGKLLQIAIGIARGLEYLQRGCNTRILNFDVKPHNILLDKDLCPKISDFGLAKLFPNEGSMISMSCMRGTPGYIAPELFSRNFGQISHKSDVYSYGMMILEMVGGRKNIEDDVDHTSEIYFPHWIYKKVELHDTKLGLYGIMNDEENEMARKMIIIGLWCIQTNPLSRPTITKVLEMLEGDLASMEIPPKPYMSSPSRTVGSSSTS
ncbi:hypothetical protein L6452_18114 [Arctium lappa]|uniref:Uncharacterized protein n=1 Tax=Arctium lappa TaxID=4217 RepID=A0ACB9C577_ARCLA|nr:hypothetical protein L6452_18114 [Arctium lappa]